MTNESTHSSTTPTHSSTSNGPHVYLVTKTDEADAITNTGPHVYLVLSALNSVPPIAEADMKEHTEGLNLHLALSGEEKQLPVAQATQAQPFKMLISYHYYKRSTSRQCWLSSQHAQWCSLTRVRSVLTHKVPT